MHFDSHRSFSRMTVYIQQPTVYLLGTCIYTVILEKDLNIEFELYYNMRILQVFLDSFPKLYYLLVAAAKHNNN